MRILSRCLPLVAVVYLASYLRFVEGLPVEEAAGRIRNSRMRHPQSPMFNPHQKFITRKIIRPSDLPSPADLLRPDTFQFYTFDKSGEVITKQMTKHEIQSLIAAGGGHLPPMALEIHEPHQAGDVPTGGTRVADVVQNVQNVLKGELSKPPSMMSTIPKIPGHANSEWSSILPSILSGDMETIPLSPEPAQEDRIPVYVGQPESSEITEKPMIQVPVITVESKLPIQNDSTSDHEPESGTNGPVFQILNTISADRVKNNSYAGLNDQLTDASESIDKSNVKPQIVNQNESKIAVSSTQKPIEGVKEDMISIVSETHSTSIKIPGYDEMKIDNESKLTRRPVATTTEKIVTHNDVKPEKSEATTLKPVEIVDKFEKIQPIKPVLLNNVLKKPGLYSSTMTEAEMTTLKTSEMISTTVRNESVTTEAVSTTTEVILTTTEQDKVADIIPLQIAQDSSNVTLNNTKIIETTSVENTSDETTEVTQHDSTTESKILDPIITTDSVLMTTETSSSILMEGIKLKDPVTEIVFESTPEATEKTNDVTIEEMSTTMSSELSTQSQPERTELPIELEDSLSSMISQISEAIIEPSLPAMNDAPETDSDEVLTTENINQEIFSTIQPITTESASTEQLSAIPESTTSNIITLESFLKSNITSDDKDFKVKPSVATQETETPIVRIDIMLPTQTTEAQLNASLEPAKLKLNVSLEPEKFPEESPVVRIQLTDPVSTVNHIIESLPPESYSVAPEIEPLTLPAEINITANNVSSSLIAGFSNNEKPIPDNITVTDDAIIVESAQKKDPVVEIVKPEEKIPEVTTETWETTTDQMLQIMLQQINFDELPIFQRHKQTPVTSSPVIENKNETKIESSTEPETPPIKLNNETPNTDKNVTTSSPLSSPEPETKADNKSNVTEPEVNNSKEIPAAKIEVETEIKGEVLSSPSKIQLDDLPIVEHKINKPEVIKPSLPKRNITENYKKDEPLTVYLKPPPISSSLTNVYEDDPYKKLGEPMEVIPTTELPQTTTNKTLKIKDQKKDSSMELMEKVPLIAMNQIPSHQDKKPFTTSTIASALKTNEEVHSESEKWTLIPQKSPPALKSGVHAKRPAVESITPLPESTTQQNPKDQIPLTHSKTDEALDSSVTSLEPDISYFSNLCNDLAFSFWTATNEGLSTTRSLAVSPFGMTSMLAMVFLGARGPTSEKMNNLLRLDDVASFNPHLIFQNVTDSVGLARKQGIANAAFVRELFADRVKVRKLLPFYKEQAQQFYDGVVAEVNFATISDLVRRRTNLMVRKQTGGRIKDFVRTNSVPLRSPLAALSANVFQTDCNSKDASSDGRDGELYFAVSPAIRQRKLVPVPSTVWRAGVLAGYEPNLDATAIALGGPDKLVSTIFVIPGQQGFTAPGDNLELLEERLIRGATHDGAWNKLLKVIIPRPGLELQVPKFSHRSVINATEALKRMGLQELFDKHADLKGINGVGADLHLTDVLQMNLFSTCGDENIQSGRHHVEVYPSSPQRNSRAPFEFPRAYKPRFSEPSTPSVQRENVDKPRLKLDRPFLYFVRHNPTGLILHMGRFNPRLLP